MSTVSLSAGNTSWLDSITCDLCGEKVERKSTGEMRRVELPIEDPRVIEQNRGRHTVQYRPLPEIEYEERSFDSNALRTDAGSGWTTRSLMRSLSGTSGPGRSVEIT